MAILLMRLLSYAVAFCLLLIPSAKIQADDNWQRIVQQGQGQDVYWHAWGGDPQVNLYIQWVAKQVLQQYKIRLHHVKLADTSEAVSRILAEKAAGNEQQGSVDLIWINGE